jgi:hypothetical protein
MDLMRRAADTPQLLGGDALTIERVPHLFQFERSVAPELANRLVDAINLMGGVGEAAEACYQRALDALARQARDAVKALAEEYHRLPASQYLDRWALVQLMVELRHESSLEFVDRLLAGGLPDERSADPEHASTVAEEIMIRTTAVDVLAQMAADGSGAARDLLLRHATHENFSVKRAAVQGYLAQGGEGARERLLDRLPQRDHFILDIQRVSVQQVPQATGGLHVVCRDQQDALPLHDLGRSGGGKGDPPDGGCHC